MRIAKSALLASFLLVGCASDRAPADVITQADVDRVLSTLSADDMMGRRPFTDGIDKAADFIAAEFAAAGLANLEGLDNYLQQIPAYTLTTESHSVILNRREVSAERCIFAINQREIHWSNNDGVELATIGADDNSMQAFSEIRGGDGNKLVLVHERHSRFFNRLRSYMSGARFTMALGESGSSVYVLTDNSDVRSFDITVSNSVVEDTMANVVGVIPGRRRDEIVLFGAHYDHIGVREPVDGDSVANGANDNATGTTAVVLLARYLKTLRQPERTLMFAAFTAEEMGLLGSQHLAQQLEPDHIVAMINLEMLGKPEQDRSSKAWITGFDRSSLGEILRDAVDTAEYLFYADPQPDLNLFMRSDNVAFARLGVPAHTISTGLLEDDHDYHQVTDEIETLDLSHLTRTIVAVAKAVMPLVTGQSTPTRLDPSQLN
jgi:hypothetical protein